MSVQERPAPASELWHVLVYPQEASGETSVPQGLGEPIERVVCNYHYRGWPHDLPRPVQRGGELQNAAVCFLRESSVRCTPTPGDPGYTQRGGDHEVGHMLGMLHPGGICSQSACYGTAGAQRNRIMGAGHEVTVSDYGFAMAIMHHESHARVGQRIWSLEPDRRSVGISTCT